MNPALISLAVSRLRAAAVDLEDESPLFATAARALAERVESSASMGDDDKYAWEAEVLRYDEPGSTFLQWKGTQVCMDLICLCGAKMHLDADFTYAVRCAACKKVLQLGTAVAVREAPADYTGGVVETARPWEE